MQGRDEIRKALAKAIRAARIARGLTLQQAADKYGCTLRGWQFFESGQDLRVSTLYRLAKALDVPVHKLLR